ncbi:MAG: SMC-Scp complex subunit ScpB [Planctomycetales bacterium]|nr:SMC-Scp complex subunit ScpB [Planctomycetales bacterium]
MQRPPNSQLSRQKLGCHNFGTWGPAINSAGIAPHYGRAKSPSTLHWFFIHHLLAERESGAPQAKLGDAVSVEEKRRRLEAAIFLSPEGESSRKLAKLAGLADATEARTLIRQINQELDAQGRAYRIEEVAGGYAMMTRSHFAPWLRRLSHVPGALKLSQSALETLAVVAYRQPVLRANVEAIRGVTCSEVLKQLMELDLVRISGRSEDLGRPYLYGTTRRFLQMFGLRSADRLPRMAWVNQGPLSLPTPEPADLDSESKESTVKKSFTAAALLERNAQNVDESLLEQPAFVPSAIDDDEDDFDDDDEEDDDDDDFDDDDDWDDDEEDDEEGDDDEEADDLEDEEDAAWEEVDDDDSDEDDEDDDIGEDDDDDDWEDEDDEDDDDEDDDWD